MIEVRWYYRPNEIPDGVYSLLMQDRFYENSELKFNSITTATLPIVILIDHERLGGDLLSSKSYSLSHRVSRTHTHTDTDTYRC